MFIKNNIEWPESPEELMSSASAAKNLLNVLNDPKCWSQIPLLNYTPLHKLKDLSIVRFRGMIQDMQDPEIYLERYQVTMADGTTRLQEGKYRDCLVLAPGECANYSAEENKQGERRTLFVVSLPAINEWTRNYEEQCNSRILSTTSVAPLFQTEIETTVKKRSAPSDNDDIVSMEVDTVVSSTTGTSGHEESSNKRQCVAPIPAPTLLPSVLGAEYLLNSPIPQRPGKACMIKVYSDFDTYTLNSLVDVIGFLSVDPALDASTIDVDMCKDLENVSELQAQNPPPSLIPRLHAIAVHQLPHHNPLLDDRMLVEALTTDVIDNATAAQKSFDMLSVQKELRVLLTLCLFNDEFAADYLLAHLISTVYSRSEMESIGKFALNICNLPQYVMNDESAANYTRKLYEVLELLVPASHYLPMSLKTMNTAAFVPKKDYETSRLVSGLLQLAPHTHLVLDETHLQQGKLEANGVAGVQSLAQLINHQQIKCNFHFYDIDYNADIPVLLLSEGRSMLPHDFLVPLHTEASALSLIEVTLKAAQHYLQQGSRLDQFRRFLTMAKTRSFNVSSEQSEIIQQDFVEMRKAKVIESVDELHALLVLSRLLAIGHGKTVLDQESWQLAKDMESKRKIRVKLLPISSRNMRV